MTLDTTGALLEGVRVSTGNSGFTYPPRSIVTDPGAFANVSGRAEYLVAAMHPSAYGTDIGDPLLSFSWSRNERSVVRFDYDNFNRRWNTSPGSSVDTIGVLSNSPRLKYQVPDLLVTSSPFDLWLGFPTRMVTFSVHVVENSTAFGSPIPGTIEISKETGELNFSAADLADPSYVGATLYGSRQSFFDRTKTSGSIGPLPESSSASYALFLNPRPAIGQIPRVRVGFRPHLQPISVATELDFSVPASGTFQWAATTGKLRFAPSDITSFSGETVYYDGIFISSFQLVRTNLGVAAGSWPTPAYTTTDFLGIVDPLLFYIFSNVGGTRTYFQVIIVDTSSSALTSSPPDGSVYLDKASGHMFMSSDDVRDFGLSISYVHSVCPIEHGASIQLFRSGVNFNGASAEPDFVTRYSVTKQIITDNIPQAPFAMLPTVPVVDSTLTYSIDSGPGSTGSFSGILVNSNDPTAFGFGYELDLDHKKLTFSNRKKTSLTLQKDEALIKLTDSMIFAGGFQASKNGIPIRPGVDFDFNATAGLLEFITPIGENDPANILGVSGVFAATSFTTSTSSFSPRNIGQFLFVNAGANAGIYKIKHVPDPHTVIVDVDFPSAGSGTADIRTRAEILADRFWQDFSPPYKKFSMTRTNVGISHIFAPTEFTVLSTTSQVNITTPANPDDIFQVNYVSLDSPDNGVTVTPTHRTEFAAFKVRQEAATVTSGSSVVHINPSGKTVDTAHPMKVYVDGVTQDPATYKFTRPGSITLGNPLTIEQVTVDYWIRQATGGETNFNLLFSPIDIDSPKITAGEITSSFNSDQTGLIQPGCAIMIDGKEIVIIASVSYDGTTDTTKVTFEETPVVSSDPNSKLQITQSITGIYRVVETLSAAPFPKNTNTIVINGKAPYVSDMIVTVNSDPYRVAAVKYDAVKGQTSVITTVPAKFNYIIPRITRTIRPVLSSGGAFQTSEPAHIGYPFTLVLGGAQHRILTNGVDYQVGEGGALTLKENLISGDILYALYVGRVVQPTGTLFDLNYAYGIAANDANGIKGQRLSATYNLLAPDTFFFRIETVQSFLPEVIQELQKSASSGGSSGPNISNSSSLKTKDFGSPSLYFDEQHLGNLDVVLSRLLKFYNDFANTYEDILANFDGRVVGGQSGRFRFDGIFNNPTRSDYPSITNDIDDKILLYENISITDFFTFVLTPVYGYMWENNNFSRLFPTIATVSAALNGSTGTSNFGKPLGSFGISNITSASIMVSTRATSHFISDRTGTSLTLQKNGDAKALIPPFASGQKVKLYSNSGVADIAATISSVTGSGPYTIVISPATTLPSGAIVQDTSDPTISSNHFYAPGRDIGVNNDNGQIVNITLSLPAPLDHLQTTVAGNEIVDCVLTFQNLATTPTRIPALDGFTKNDGGSSAAPLLSYSNETDLLAMEDSILNRFGTATVAAGGGTIAVNPVNTGVGDTVTFLSGPNVGHSATVLTLVSVLTGVYTVTVSPAFPFADAIGSNVLVTQASQPDLNSILSQELAILQSSTVSPPAAGATIGTIQNEISAAVSIMSSYGSKLASGTTASVNALTITDSSADFMAANIQPGALLIIPQGSNIGLYKIATVVDAHSLTIDPTAPFLTAFPFVASAVTYSVLLPWSFLSSKEFAFPNSFISKTLAFAAQTSTWASSYSVSGVTARRAQIVARQTDIATFIKQISGLLGKDDNIYDSRYLWISSRVDKKTGTLIRQQQSVGRRLEATVKLLQDQQRLLIASRLM